MTSDKNATSRSDKVRQRRDRRARGKATTRWSWGRWDAGKKKTKKAPKSRRTTKSSPVLMRSGKATMPVRRRKPARARRRYDVALGNTGAELRLPALPQVGLGWRAVSGLMAALLVALLFYFWNTPTYRVQAVEVRGVQRLNAKHVNAALNLSGVPIFALDPAQLETILVQAFPEFSSVDVSLGLPNAVRVTVTERQPVVAWRQENSTTWVDAEGIAFPPRGEVGALPVVASEVSLAFSASEEALADDPAAKFRLLSPDLVAAIQSLSRHVPDGTLILYDPEFGLGWEDPQGWVVYFGMSPTEMETRLRIYEALSQKLVAEGVRPALISMEHMHAPYYKMER